MRCCTSRFGRWLSADWSSVPVPVPYANLTNPQTLNLYSMVSDDPESFADLDGHVQNASMGLNAESGSAPTCASTGQGGSGSANCGAAQTANQTESKKEAAAAQEKAQAGCSDVKVAVKVTQDPKPVLNEKQEDGTSVTGVYGKLQFTITVKDKPLTDTAVDESNSGTMTVNGTPRNNPINEAHDQGTNNVGQLNDKVGPLKQGGIENTIKAFNTNAVKVEGTNTLTFKIPSGATCSATSTRTLTNIGPDGKFSANYNLTTTQPVVKAVQQ